MRTRKQIESNVFANPALGVGRDIDGHYATTDAEKFAVIMEVLLDIRELLTEKRSEI